jgi:hypothetical protein
MVVYFPADLCSDWSKTGIHTGTHWNSPVPVHICLQLKPEHSSAKLTSKTFSSAASEVLHCWSLATVPMLGHSILDRLLHLFQCHQIISGIYDVYCAAVSNRGLKHFCTIQFVLELSRSVSVIIWQI